MSNKSNNDINKSRMPRAVWTLGFVSLFMDVSSELVHCLLPVFMISTLGASTLSLGILEGFAEATALISKMFSGVLSDWLGKRKALAVIGYGLSALTKPLFPLAQTIGWVFTARIVDRIGKGIRGAPRDALVAEITPYELRGAAYGLRQSLDTVGAFVGPILAIVLMLVFANDIRSVYWFAVIPGVMAVVLLVFFVHEPERKGDGKPMRFPISKSELAKLGSAYWWIVIVGGVLTMARFSEAFLVLRAQSVGLSAAWVPMVMVVMSVVYSLAAYPVGVLSDRIDRRSILIIGTGILIIADIILAFATSIWGVMIGVAFWGLHMGFSQGLLATLVADTTPKEMLGTAFGAFNFVSGIVLLAASALAGLLWDVVGPSATFLAGAGFTAVSFVGLLILYGKKRVAPPIL
ncbi:MAG: MFS transporter [Alphaproteobacteria bacterium]|nr:MFS transporter [Alphaproteobacteria bacterium]